MSADRRGKNVMLWKKCPFLYGSFTWLKIQLQTLAYKRQRESKKEEWEERRKWDGAQKKGKTPDFYKKGNSRWIGEITSFFFFQPPEKKNNGILGGRTCKCLRACTCSYVATWVFQHTWQSKLVECEEGGALVWICLLLLLLNGKLSAYCAQLVTVHRRCQKENKCEKTNHRNNVKLIPGVCFTRLVVFFFNSARFN